MNALIYGIQNVSVVGNVIHVDQAANSLSGQPACVIDHARGTSRQVQQGIQAMRYSADAK